MKNSKTAEKLFLELLKIMEILRSPRGCPWDRKQTHKSLVKYLFEESKEVRLAVNKKDWKNLEEELGDILLQVVFHARVAKENRTFDIKNVIKTLNQKLIRRHPHVFGGKTLKTPEEVIRQWKKIKLKEKQSPLKTRG